MDFTLSPCNMRLAFVAVGFYLLGSGDMAITDLETILGAAFPTFALIWKAMDARKAAAAAAAK